jgi:exopolysaccharide/PEP-CTERM locus tyrosine autokinase
MSIIERALGKLQQASPRGEPATIPVRRRHDPTVTDTSSTVRPKRPPTETIDVSLDMLRKGGVLAPEEHMHSLIDQFRRVKWPLLQSALSGEGTDSKPGNLIMVTSSVAGEGKTFTSFNLAMSMAREADWSVLLVDADVAKRHASEVFNTMDRRGLNDAIQDPTIDVESLVLGTTIQGLSVLPAGRKSSTAPELFASQRMVDIANTLAAYDSHRIVLFDSSPLLATNESQVLSKLVGQIVLVVRAESTAQPMVLEAVSLLENTEKVRCILNQVRASRMTEYYYEYGYYPNDKPKD